MAETPVLPGHDCLVEVDGAPLRLHVVRYGREQHGVRYGREQHGVQHGPDSTPPLLLLHGVGESSALWSDVATDLGHACPVVVPDLPGAGASEHPRDRRLLALDGQARVLAALVRTLNVDRVVVAGAGLGGAVAVHLSAQAPELVAGLALLSSPLTEDVWPPSAAAPLLPRGLGELALRLPGRRQRGRGLLATLRTADLAAVESSWRIVATSPPPALVLWGGADPVLPESYGHRLAAELPGAQWVPVAGAGHQLPRERPERVAEELAAFAADCR